MRLPPFLRVPVALAATTGLIDFTVDGIGFWNSLRYAIALLGGCLLFVFAILWWTGKENFDPVGHGGAPPPKRATPLMQRSIIPFSMLWVFTVFAMFGELYSIGNRSLLETHAGALFFAALVGWLVCSAAFGRPRFLLPKVLRTGKKAA
jgi:hypothetical protein